MPDRYRRAIRSSGVDSHLVRLLSSFEKIENSSVLTRQAAVDLVKSEGLVSKKIGSMKQGHSQFMNSNNTTYYKLHPATVADMDKLAMQLERINGSTPLATVVALLDSKPRKRLRTRNRNLGYRLSKAPAIPRTGPAPQRLEENIQRYTR